ncbi:phenylalanyl-tRNA synthetase subunit beta [Porphyromonas crevioricanis]|uniref:Phenylalanine--tRNA ligase beta subunit n=2 Tax=Porphyromonas crevioricanis TaxID=393921 RepID=A0A0A2FN80_9PORP|nr:phenylalanine--tRNA ligase subunit beta [Porphyromonas crevioricanis]KGN89739.1 phenylalanyl-tRNA synthetase subunit beta [Porphyromonas crevioricanis]SJZ76152.1 phenylalanyl-tRNA synthetase beta subunit [Porphyromonas crevioricanis]SQH72309.1 Phenylalanine--tRNA ligase beta subunit [Porphyromonas crevioricanis]GAD04441.1 phenylalanyl-tRNA synthetase beta chain [Porphyromonas crevioricanis JCM 15906]GAD07026.1 phenylalanyl-tRNA synthetase beta chain [Porphyromonas crevioricanis JCM 13913]
MNISYNRLRRYIDIDLSPNELSEILTSIGLEVSGVNQVESIPGGLKGLVVGHVLTCEPHPDSTHLHVTSVDVGLDTPLQIVCGAPNVAAGLYVVVATIGTILGQDQANPFLIKKSRLRGVDSFGMICSESEIGVGKSCSGIISLPAEEVYPGMPAAEFYRVETDYVIEVDITPNRVDATSHYGVARDLAAYLTAHTGKVVRAQYPELPELIIPEKPTVPVEIACPAELCPRFEMLRIDGVRVGESPTWLANTIRAIGLKPINNIVDISNFVLHELGQPLHCYDADMVDGGVVVRLAQEGESFVTLDGVERKLTADDIIIASGRDEPLCIAGVLGGLESGTTERTASVLIEAANFHPTSVRKTARRLGINSDASFRFERGLDANNTHRALLRAAALIQEIAGGQITSAVTDIYSVKQEPHKVALSLSWLDRLIGKKIPQPEVETILEALEIRIADRQGDTLQLEVPRYRTDVTRDVDVAEEILRIYGYNNVELDGRMTISIGDESQEDRQHNLSTILSEQLVGAGFNEILCNSLTSSSFYHNLHSCPESHLVRLINPLSNELDVMRSTLLFGGLQSLSRNEHRKANRFYYFEWGNVYSFVPSDKSESSADVLSSYQQETRLALWIAGQRVSGSWAHPDEASSVSEIKAHVMNILKRSAVDTEQLELREGGSDLYKVSMDIYASNTYLGTWGIISPSVTKAMDIPFEVYYAELSWQAIFELGSRRAGFEAHSLPKYPEVKRDLALLIDKEVSFARIQEVARNTERKLLRRVELFDVYEGKHLPEGKKSYAVSFYLRDDNRTMSEKQIESIMNKLIQAMDKQLGASLR